MAFSANKELLESSRIGTANLQHYKYGVRTYLRGGNNTVVTKLVFQDCMVRHI